MTRTSKKFRIAIVAAALFMPALWVIVSQPVFFPGKPSPAAGVDAARLERHVRMLSTSFIPRDCEHTGNLDLAAAYISREFQLAGGNVSEQVYQPDSRAPGCLRGKTYRNVIATFGPDTRERIVVGAHYDAFGPLPGADDNASGVAGLIELAYLFGRRSVPLRVELVAFTLEEPVVAGGPGLFRSEYGGSHVHATSLRNKAAGVRMMIALEMIGYFSDEPNSQRFPNPLLRLFYPSRGNFALVVGRLGDGLLARRVKAAMQTASSLPVYSINAPAALKGMDWSDHFNYWKQGYPAVMVTDTADNRNRNYHTEGDRCERLDYRRMTLIVAGVYEAVLAGARE